MLQLDPIVAGTDVLAAVKTYCRIDGTDEDGVIAALAASAIARAELWLGQVLLRRAASMTLMTGPAWTRLPVVPVVAVTGVTAGDVALPVGDYAIELDADGARVRLTTMARRSVRVALTVGAATDWGAIAEPVRHGIVRLVAHDHAARERGEDSAPPPGVLALWRASRRMVLA